MDDDVDPAVLRRELHDEERMFRRRPLSATYSHDGRTIFAGFSDGSLAAWDTDTVFAGMSAGKGEVHPVVQWGSPDCAPFDLCTVGKESLLAMAGAQYLLLWDTSRLQDGIAPTISLSVPPLAGAAAGGGSTLRAGDSALAVACGEGVRLAVRLER